MEDEKYYEMYGDLYLQQLALEQESKDEAENCLKETLEKARHDGLAGEGKLAGRFMEYTWQSARDNIQALVEAMEKPNKTVQGHYVRPLKELVKVYNDNDKLVDTLCLTTLSTIMSQLFKRMDMVSPCNISSLAKQVSVAIKAEADVEKFFMEQSTKDDIDMPWLKHSMDLGISKRVQNSYKLAYARHRMEHENFKGFNWDVKEKEALGAKLIEMTIKGSDYFELSEVEYEGSKLTAVVFTEWFLQAWQVNENNMIARAIKYHPTIIPPKPWTTPYDGGYYGASVLGTEFIRVHYEDSIFVKNYKKRLKIVDLSFIYRCLNNLQDTPFKINRFILDTLTEIYATGGELGGVPRTEPLPMLPMLPEGTPADVVAEHKKKLVALYKREEARKTKALRFLTSLQVAKKFSKYNKIYFPWNIDYRGRCYPIPTSLHPQGDDIQKSLLLFANPSPLSSDDDIKWLKIHGANLAGVDKVSFEERQAWVDTNEAYIIASAYDPLGYRWWYQVSENDYPMEFLAFCKEYADLKEYIRDHGTAVGFMSSLPIAFDGTCSGLQHFSALLRDEVGGFAVNLMPSDKVQDIYSLVAQKVNPVLLKDSISGTEDSEKEDKKGNKTTKYGTKTLARLWVMFNRQKFGQDGITRKVCKRSVMTLAYGSKQYGFAENLIEDIIKPFMQEHPDEVFTPANRKQAATYMAKLIWEAVKTTVVKAVEGMDWLQKVSKLIVKGNNVVTWKTPNGLPVQQNYCAVKTDSIQLRFNGARVRFYTVEADDGNIDKAKQLSGIAPNFIHSLDATHLQRVVNAEKDKGNSNFMMIHDSFGTDVAHAGQLYKTIREEFVNLYKDTNLLQYFLEDALNFIADEDLDEVPSIPSFGTLDVEEVLNSQFCFA